MLGASSVSIDKQLSELRNRGRNGVHGHSGWGERQLPRGDWNHEEPAVDLAGWRHGMGWLAMVEVHAIER